MSRRPGRIGEDRGSATVWVLALSAVLAVLGVAIALVAAAAVARHRAGTAADLAALAA
ncbi:MAG: Helicase/secretion neighborhood TadE-like protein, partial [Blastococcus sp.]|nr:Helicase/secretion neighborhood TadE-like protein [Blastococcus sp.]